jgi:predicted RNA methylase
MKNADQKKAGKDLYRQLRQLSWEQLWTDEAPRFNQAPPPERIERVALVRAVGVVFSESGNPAQKDEVKAWFLALLRDPAEKIRRYAAAALPKIGAGADEEAKLLALWQTTPVAREKKFAARALEKIGGATTLQTLSTEGVFPQMEQKIKAGIARAENPSAVRMEGVLSDFAGLRIHLRGRRGLEKIVAGEVAASVQTSKKFRIDNVSPGLVALTPLAPFSLADIYAWRCFGTVGFVPGRGKTGGDPASIIASPLARRTLGCFTTGATRYRINFIDKGRGRGAIRQLAGRVFSLCPEMLNDGRSVTWTVDIYPGAPDGDVELRPNLTPDPRFYYRRHDVPAASHPHLAASMARLAGRVENEIIWDPFCGSGLELVESALLGGLGGIHGTDLSAEAIAIARDNLAAAHALAVPTHFDCCDFRDYAQRSLSAGAVTLILTNPPMGMRVPVADLHGLIHDLFAVAARILPAGGRLVLANPISMPETPRPFRLHSRQPVDFGGFECRMEKYVKH